MFYPEIDDENELKERLKELFESHNFATGKMDKTAHYNPETKQIECGRIARKIGGKLNKPDQLTYCIDIDDGHKDHIFLTCSFKEQETGTFLVSYEITTNFCKGKYRSAPPTNGHITIVELIQDLEDAINRKKEDWYFKEENKMIRLWYVEEPGKYTHTNGRSLGIFKYESSAKIYLEQLNKIPGNDKRTFVINHYDEPISKFPEWSWVWNFTEREENKLVRGE